MKVFSLLLLLTATLTAEVPEIFKGFFEEEVPVKANIGMVMPPVDIEKFIGKVETAARKNPEWFKEYSTSAQPGVPLPYHVNLGLTKEEYDEYIALWAKREFKPQEEVVFILRKTIGNNWTLTATGGAGVISTLRYDPEKDTFRSPSGTLTRLDDIKADDKSILGAWAGKEWRYQETGILGSVKQNFALGKFDKGNYGLVIFREQEVSTEGTRLLDRSLVVRFTLGEAGQIKPPAKPVSKPK
jgi:hypothetical protein